MATKYDPGLHGIKLPPRDVHALIYRNGWKEPVNMVKMIATIDAESSLFTEAVGRINPNGTQDFGLFQLNDGHWSRFAGSRDDFVKLAFNPEEAAKVARTLWHDDQQAGGSGFRPWAAYTSGAYKQYLPIACTSIANFCAVQTGIPLVI